MVNRKPLTTYGSARRQDQVDPHSALPGAAGLGHLDEPPAPAVLLGDESGTGSRAARLGVSSDSIAEMSFRYAELELIVEHRRETT
jgi:hypothetical protein